MPINPTYPGVYIEELENPVKTIVGVSTSVTAFVGRALQGPLNDPVLIHNFGEFESIFGGLWKKSTMSYSVRQYFLNGGRDAIIVRVFNGDDDAAKTRFTNGGTTLKFEAKNPGKWANKLKVVIDSDVVNEDDNDPASLFHIKVPDENDIELETFLNVSHKPGHKRYVVTVLDEESDLIQLDEDTLSALSAKPPDGNYVSDNKGSNGPDLADTDIVPASSLGKKGIYALDNTDIFNLLCIPPPDPAGTTNLSFYSGVYAPAAAYCHDKRAMLIMDPPSNWESPEDPVKNDIGIDAANSGISRDENAVIYFPRIKAPDPLEENRAKFFPPCGAIAGIIARTDAQRGVWKAPAGTETSLAGIIDLEVKMTDEENGRLNQKAVNCLRILPTGKVVWGARTLKGEDTRGSQWKYLPVRRMALYIEETLYRNTNWVVFEPNDEPLWSQIRLNIGAFMHDLFTKGAFQGSTPKEAYLVKCDKETTTQYDIDRGIVNILVGFAPLKPAEFVIIKIQQLAGQMEGQ
jgi:phage tail sheath protein FI